MERAVVCVSGGLDSCVTTAIAAREYELLLLHVNYGQLTQAREARAFSQIADFYRVPEERRLLVDLPWLGKVGGSALTDPSIPLREADLAPAPGPVREVPASYVPFRNTIILSAAVAWAEAAGAGRVYIGVLEEDSSGYPDCREEYIAAMQRVVELGTRPQTRIRLVAPLIHTRRTDAIRLGMELGAPLHLTWSCYKNSLVACGRCDSCALRLAAFAQAGLEDPIPYERR